MSTKKNNNNNNNNNNDNNNNNNNKNNNNNDKNNDKPSKNLTNTTTAKTSFDSPTINIKTSKSINSANSTSVETAFQTAKEEAGVYEVVSENYLLLLGISSALIIIIIIYFFSQTFRVDRTVSKLVVYQGYQQLKSLDYSKVGQKRFGDFYVESAYNAAHCYYQMYDYTSENVVLSILQSGARYIEFNVFNSEFGDKAFPVVSMGYKTGEWKMMVTDTPLETIFETIANNAFTLTDGKNGVNNPEDPLFIGLVLNTNSNLSCLNLIAFLITKYFGNRLLDNSYSFQNNDNIGDIEMIQLMSKVTIFASDGFQGSGLEELINYSWDNVDNNNNHSMQRLHYSTILEPTFDTNKLIDYNRTGLTIIVPNKEGDFFSNNYDSKKAFELGCQFVAMNLQNVSIEMDGYISRFKKHSFVMKNNDLQKGNSNRTLPYTTIPNTSTTTTRPQATRAGF
jgi:hypothetical protein